MVVACPRRHLLGAVTEGLDLVAGRSPSGNTLVQVVVAPPGELPNGLLREAGHRGGRVLWQRCDDRIEELAGGGLSVTSRRSRSVWWPRRGWAAIETDEEHAGRWMLHTGVGETLGQRRMATLHAAGLAVGGAAAVLLGRSGVGKSTLTVAALREGVDVLADDVVVVGVEGGVAWATGLSSTARLSRDGLALAGGGGAQGGEVGRTTKEIVPLGEDPGEGRLRRDHPPVRLVAVVERSDDGTAGFEDVPVEVVLERLNRGMQITPSWTLQSRLDAMVAMLAGARLVRLRLGASPGETARLVKALLAGLQDPPSASPTQVGAPVAAGYPATARLGDQLLVLDPDGPGLAVLGGAAVELWPLLAAGAGAGELASHLERTYGMEPTQAEMASREWLDQLADVGLSPRLVATQAASSASAI